MVGWTNGWMFDVSNRAHQRSFKGFIEFVRSSLGVDGTVMQHARRLPPQRVTPVFQDLALSASQSTVVTLRLRTDNLYVVGFRNTGGQWFEFRGEGGGHTINGSTMLRFSGGYVGRGLGTLASVTDINVESSATMEDAVRGLAGYRGEAAISEDRLKVWLRTLIVSFIESSRFTGMADCVAAALSGSEQEKKDTRFTTSLVEQIHNWSSLSKALLDAANDVSLSNDGRIHFATFGKCNIHNAYEAAAALGLVLSS